jgi:hypothetical protein
MSVPCTLNAKWPYVRRYVCVLPPGFDDHVGDVGMLRLAKESDPDDELLVRRHDRAFLRFPNQGVADCDRI